MNELSLFAGAGGGLLGSRLLGHRIVCAVEYEPYCIETLCRRQEEGHLEAFPIWDDVRTFDGKPWRGKVDLITAGFPCQPYSVAGKGKGKEDERNMWPDTIRVIREVRPKELLLENVTALLSFEYYGTILWDLASSGYDMRWDCIPAGALGGHFIGDRLFIASNDATSCGSRQQGGWAPSVEQNTWGRDEFERLVRLEVQHGVPAGKIGRICDGVAHRVDRLKAIGNGQVPAVVRTAWELLKEA